MRILAIADIDDFHWKRGSGQADVLVSHNSPRRIHDREDIVARAQQMDADSPRRPVAPRKATAHAN